MHAQMIFLQSRSIDNNNLEDDDNNDNNNNNHNDDNDNDNDNDDNYSWKSHLAGGFIRFHYDTLIINKQEQQHVKHLWVVYEQNTRPQNEES